MRKMIALARSFRDDEDGAAMIEYSVLIGIITVGTIAMILLVGAWVTAQWTALDTALPDAPPPPA